MNSRWKPHLALIIANTLYALSYVVAKGVMPVFIMPLALTFLRILPSTILFWIAGTMVQKEVINKEDYPKFLLSGFFGIFLSQYIFIAGLNLSSPIDAAIIMTTNPVIVLLVALAMRHETISKSKMYGVITGAFGAMILVLSKGFSGFDKGHLAGNVILMLNSVSFGFYMIFVGPLMKKYHSITVLKWIFLIGAVMYLPVGVSDFSKVQWSNVSPGIIASLVYIVVGTTFITYLLINYALRTLKATTVSMYTYIQPVITTILASIIGMDKLTLVHIIAALLVFLGVYLVGKNKL
jgi:drug/metabolite transporter (DMT)-like permease